MAASGAQSQAQEAAFGRESAPFQERASLIFTAQEGDAGVPEQPGGSERRGIQEEKAKKKKKSMHLKNEQVNEARRPSGGMEDGAGL